MLRKLGDTITIDFCTHDASTGMISDADSTPTCEVFEDTDDTSLSGITVTKRAGKTGNYRVSIACTAPNGFEIGKSYNAIVTATVGSIEAKAVVCSFTLDSIRVSEVPITVWDQTKTDHTHIGTFGTFLDAKISDISGGSGPSAGSIADAVQDELASDHTAANSFGRFVDAQVSARPTNPLLTNDSRLNALDTSISSRSSQVSVNAIPTTPLLANDPKLDALDTSISSRASHADITAIPTNPLLDDDPRLDYLNSDLSSIANIESQILDRVSNMSNITRLIVTPALPASFLRADAGDHQMKFNVLLFDNTGVPMNSKDRDATATDDVINYNGFGVKAEFEDGTGLTLYKDDLTTQLDTVPICHHAAQLVLPQELIYDSTGVYHFWINLDSSIATGNYTLLFGQFDHGQAADGYTIADHHHEARSFSIIKNTGIDGIQDIVNAIQSDIEDSTYGLDALLMAINSRLSSSDPRLDSLDTSISGVGLTIEDVADAVWNALLADHTTAGSFGSKNQKSIPSENISDYTTNVSQLALEATLNEIKGVSWSNETLVQLASFLTSLNSKVDTTLSTRSSQTSVNSIPTNPLLTTDSRIDTTLSSRASQSSVDNILSDLSTIPQNPLLSDDTRLDTLDASISSRASQGSVDAIPLDTLRADDTRIDYLDASISSIQSGSGPSVEAIADAVWNEAASDHTEAGSVGEKINDFTASIGDITASVDLTTLEEKLDLALTDISAIPTNPLRDNDTRLDSLDTSISSRASQGSVNTIPTDTLRTDDTRIDYLDAPISSIVDTLNDFTVIVGDVTATVDLTSIEDKIDAVIIDISAIPTNPLLSDDTRLDYIDASISSIHLDIGDMTATVDLTSIEDKIALILADTSELQTKWDIGGSLYEMLHGLTGQNSGSGTRLVEIEAIDGTETLMAVQVHIYSGRTHVAFGNTDLAGKFTALLDDGTYQVVCAKVGYVFTNPTNITVTQDDTFTVAASSITISPPNPAETCRVYEFCFTTDGTPMPSITAIGKIISVPFDCTGKLISGEHVYGVYDPVTGLVYWDFVQGAKVQFEIWETFVSVIKRIPTTASARLSEIIR